MECLNTKLPDYISVQFELLDLFDFDIRLLIDEWVNLDRLLDLKLENSSWNWLYNNAVAIKLAAAKFQQKQPILQWRETRLDLDIVQSERC